MRESGFCKCGVLEHGFWTVAQSSQGWSRQLVVCWCKEEAGRIFGKPQVQYALAGRGVGKEEEFLVRHVFGEACCPAQGTGGGRRLSSEQVGL